jgi:hypothetical protein
MGVAGVAFVGTVRPRFPRPRPMAPEAVRESAGGIRGECVSVADRWVRHGTTRHGAVQAVTGWARSADGSGLLRKKILYFPK